ncbi:MAG: DUF1080 domain-containing protein [Planctomycetota bacterium]|jgi:hypothetical protein|nr:DUF1080 domain-containing protein [Planctomycetota bacterium]
MSSELSGPFVTTLEESAAASGFVSLFNGEDLSGWDGDEGLWSVEDGAIVGQFGDGEDIPHNKFLIWRGGEPKNFELHMTFWQDGNNSGIQYRSKELTEEVGPFGMSGYQCDVHPNPPYNCQLYEERGRGIVAFRGQDVLLAENGDKYLIADRTPAEEVRNDEWHKFSVIANGNHLIQKLDDEIACEIYDHDPEKRALEGLIGIQLHRGPAMVVKTKDIWMKVLPDGGMLSPDETPLPEGATKME